MAVKKGPTSAPEYYPPTRKAWRKWLQQNHDREQSVWLIGHRQETGKPSVPWAEAVEEALCFGWIDSVRYSIGDGAYKQYFSRRKPRSTWSRINKDKVQMLMDSGQMTDAGLAVIRIAQENGSWNSIDAAEADEMPEDLMQAFRGQKGMKNHFLSLSRSVRKMMLHRIVMAKRPETRQKRILEIVAQLREGLEAKP